MKPIESFRDFVHSFTFHGRRSDTSVVYNDTAGGLNCRDITQQICLDNVVTQGIRNDTRGDTPPTHTWGREKVFPFLASETSRLLHTDEEGTRSYTGKLFEAGFNGAPRDGVDKNGHRFLRGRIGEKLRLTGPPLCFQYLKNKIRGELYEVTGFSETQQNRSSAFLAAGRNRRRSVPCPEGLSLIPDPREESHIAIIDAFGNVRLQEGVRESIADLVNGTKSDEYDRQLITIAAGNREPQLIEVALDYSLREIGHKQQALRSQTSNALLLPVLYLDRDREDRPTIAGPHLQGMTTEIYRRRSAFFHLSGIHPDEDGPISIYDERFIQDGDTVSFNAPDEEKIQKLSTRVATTPPSPPHTSETPYPVSVSSDHGQALGR